VVRQNSDGPQNQLLCAMSRALIWYNPGPCSIYFFSGSERSLACFVAVGISFWRISRFANNSPF